MCCIPRQERSEKVTLGVGRCHDADGVRDHKRRESFFNGRDLGERNDQLFCLVSKRDKEGGEGGTERKEMRRGSMSTDDKNISCLLLPQYKMILFARKKENNGKMKRLGLASIPRPNEWSWRKG